jgi:lipid-binding SYLF domain-containing protein
MTDLLATKPGAESAPAVALLAKVRATPAVGTLYDDLIRNAKGLVFMSTWKAGIMYVGGQVGSGFVVAHLPNGDWSAPAFFKWHAAGGGITLGISRAETVIVLNTDKALAQYQSPDMDFKFGAGLSVDYVKPDGSDLEGGSLKAHISSGDRDAFVFNFAKGLLFDLTITGGVTTSDASSNAKVYPQQPGITPDRILAGQVPHPPVAAPLYSVLGAGRTPPPTAAPTADAAGGTVPTAQYTL